MAWVDRVVGEPRGDWRQPSIRRWGGVASGTIHTDLHITLARKILVILSFIVQGICLFCIISFPLLARTPPLAAFRAASLLENLDFLGKLLQK
jgi:hypothetical protein